MRYLLDTHILLWALQDYSSLGVDTRLKMKQADYLYVSAASIWEARVKAAAGKLELPTGFLNAVAQSGFSELQVSWDASDGIAEVELPHRDPIDRMLIIQAEQEQLRLLTADDVLLKAYPELCLDARA